MACFHPMQAWGVPNVRTGKRSIFFRYPSVDRSTVVQELTLPCGKCDGCRVDRARQWSVRCLHESQLHSQNAFLTLTYDDEHLPPGGSLSLTDLQKFLKRLRKAIAPKLVRYFACGEYGERLSRPHYHMCLFGYGFPDREFYSKNPSGSAVWKSKELARLWPFGFSLIGDVSAASAAYVARYVIKKVFGESADEHYCDHETGEIRRSEFVVMSKKPGIGRGWFERFSSEVFPHDSVVVGGSKAKPPRFYDKLLEASDPEAFLLIKQKRIDRIDLADNTSARLAVKEEVFRAKVKAFRRSYEEE